MDIHSSEFKAWFGDWEKKTQHSSRVVNSKGEPMVVYHGSVNSDIVEFDPIKYGKKNIDSIGTWFTDDDVQAWSYSLASKTEVGKVYSAYLNIRRPWILKGDAGWKEFQNSFKVATGVKFIQKVSENDLKGFHEFLKFLNFDGIFLLDIPNDSNNLEKDLQDYYVALFPEQIKLLSYAGNPMLQNGGPVTSGGKYKDYNSFLPEAEHLLSKVKLSITKSTSGTNKGEYNVRMVIPKESREKYLFEVLGDENMPTWLRHTRYTKEDSQKAFVDQIASYLHEKDKRSNPQKISEFWKYFIKHLPSAEKDIYFEGRIGREIYDYFNILLGEINKDNWREYQYKGDQSKSIGAVTNWKECFYSVRDKAKTEWLKHNADYTNRDRRNFSSNNMPKAVTTYEFDDENIPEFKQIEDSLTETQKPSIDFGSNGTNQSGEILKSLDTSKLKNEGAIKVGYRKDRFLSKSVLVGRAREIIFPDNEVHNAVFAVVELDEILASHNEQTFSNTENYPVDASGRNINDRNYSGDKNAQAKVKMVAQKLNPNIIISTNATSSGTPVITVDGIVVSGNNRTMSLKLAADDEDQTAWERYQKVMYEEISYGGYGFSPNAGSQLRLGDPVILAGSSFNDPKKIKFKKPVLVRIDLDFQSYITGELNKFNKVRGKSERNIDIAIRLSNQLKDNEACQNSLVELVSEQEFVSELYTDRLSVQRFKRILLGCNIINENEVSGMFTDTSLTENGKVLYDTLLISLILDAKAIEVSQNEGVKTATKAIVNAIIPLIKNKKLSDGSLTADISNALLIQNDMVASGYKRLNEYVNQTRMFAENESFKTDKAVILNWFMNQKLNTLKTALIKYNNSIDSNTGAGLFGDNLTPQQIFDQYFTKETDPAVLNSIQVREKAAEPTVKENLTVQPLPEREGIVKNEYRGYDLQTTELGPDQYVTWGMDKDGNEIRAVSQQMDPITSMEKAQQLIDKNIDAKSESLPIPDSLPDPEKVTFTFYPAQDEKTQLESRIASLEKTKKYQTGEDLAAVEKTILQLNKALKYL